MGGLKGHRRLVVPLAIVGMFVFFSTMVASNAAAAANFTPPYRLGDSTLATGHTGLGGVDIVVWPYAYSSTGVAGMNIGCSAGILGVATIDGSATFWTNAFVAQKTATYTIIIVWQLTWRATDTTTLGGLGASYAEGSIKLYGNIQEKTSGGWLLQNNKVVTVWSQTFADGLSWISGKDNWGYALVYTAELTAGQSYYLWTQLAAHNQAAGLLIGNGAAATNINAKCIKMTATCPGDGSTPTLVP